MGEVRDYYRVNWRELLEDAMEENGETLQDLVSSTLTEEQLDQRFDSSYGGTEGCAFTAWTANFVYFPACYDGSEWVGSVPRNPNGVATEHVGGG